MVDDAAVQLKTIRGILTAEMQSSFELTYKWCPCAGLRLHPKPKHSTNPLSIGPPSALATRCPNCHTFAPAARPSAARYNLRNSWHPPVTITLIIVVITTPPLLGVGRLRAAEARWRLASEVGGGGGGERRAAAAVAGGSDEVAHQWCM